MKSLSEIIESLQNPEVKNKMKDGWIVPALPILELPLKEIEREKRITKNIKLRDVVLMALSEESSSYWKELACRWINEGFKLDEEICRIFKASVHEDKSIDQQIRQTSNFKIIEFQQDAREEC